jgi:hypothetical protein
MAIIRPVRDLPIVVERVAKLHAKGVESVIKRAAKAALKSLVNGTPVDTGRARSNWQVELDGTIVGEVEPFAPGSKLGISERANARAAISAGNIVIDRFSEANIAIFIGNNVPYIGLLNDGHSDQQPGAFVEIAVLFAQAEARSQNIVKRRLI